MNKEASVNSPLLKRNQIDVNLGKIISDLYVHVFCTCTMYVHGTL